MVKSLWNEIGMRSGKFYGVNPSKFLLSVYSFFFALRIESKKVIDPGYKPEEKEEKFRFNCIKKYSQLPSDSHKYLGINHYSWDNMYIICRPIKQNTWESTNPDLSQILISEAEVLGEDVIELPKKAFAYTDIRWAKQRYRLIQGMRYCIVPLRIEILGFDPDLNNNWTDATYMRFGFLNLDKFSFKTIDRLRFTVPEYWSKPGTKWKIGINAEKEKSPDQITTVPGIEGKYWITKSPYTTPARPDKDKPWTGAFAPFRVMCVVDLSTHPDFSKYFDPPQDNEGGGNVDAPDDNKKGN